MIDNRLKKVKFRNDSMVKGSDNGKIGGLKGKDGSKRRSDNVGSNNRGGHYGGNNGDKSESSGGRNGILGSRYGNSDGRGSSPKGRDGKGGNIGVRYGNSDGRGSSPGGRDGKGSNTGVRYGNKDSNGSNTEYRNSIKDGNGGSAGRRKYNWDGKNANSNSKNVNNGSINSKYGKTGGHKGIMSHKEGGEKGKTSSKCPVFQNCGGCQLLDMPYKKQLEQKQKNLEELLKPFCRVAPIIGMDNPYHYRNKVHAVFDHDRKGNPISGVYEANSHRVVPVESCMIEDQKADEIIGTIRGMLKSFKIRTYDEDTGYGLLRHVLIRRGFTTGEVMVVLVTSSPVFPSKNNFVKALREKHPEITTIIQNVNDRETSMVLGDKEHVLFGKGYIEDILCGCRFRISSKSFYQVNPVQTEVLYQKAIEAAGLTGKERVIDAYCGIGTIGIVASKYANEVIGVELNRDAVKDAVENAKINGIKNIRFFCNDAGKFMMNMAEIGEHVDVVFMDPPRSGSTEEFIDSVAKIRPEKVIYVSCGPETLARDLGYFRKKGYEAKMGWGVDMFPATSHVEAIILMTRSGSGDKK